MKISILVKCYNEEKNIEPMAEALTSIMVNHLSEYEYEIIFRDNDSQDSSASIIRKVASEDAHIKGIINARNYGLDSTKDTFIGRIDGDIVIIIPADFQEPPEYIPEFVYWYEKGYEIVAGQKTASNERHIKYIFRQAFYNIISAFSIDTKQIPNMSGIVLMSRRLIEMYWHNNLYEDLRYFISDIGCDVKLVQYTQQKRKYGKSSYNIWRYLSFSISSMVDTSIIPLRIATIFGSFFSLISFIIGIIYFVLKVIWWDRFPAGMIPAMIGIFFLGSVQMLFTGIVGEYVGVILKRTTPVNPPIVKELINYDNSKEDNYLIRAVD